MEEKQINKCASGQAFELIRELPTASSEVLQTLPVSGGDPEETGGFGEDKVSGGPGAEAIGREEEAQVRSPAEAIRGDGNFSNTAEEKPILKMD
ncbi:Stathmin-2 [Heterocephalus glaber]|uniref:Stathmin-2 n=1 Tax=Heterocephalus glaber TaxID=10181 RepID=G5BQ78_HETGA|nr:Stathmin-2 [Heterocephalus glaber]